MSIIQRLLSPIADVRREEGLTALLMFAYSFLAMTVWNTIKPLTRSQFIRDLGADNLPYVLLAAGLVIGVLMTGYAWLMGRLPRRWGLPIVQAGMAGLLVVFWFLFGTEAVWVSVAFYLVGMIFGLLLISQFWTVANLVYDPRQAKRLFGFIGGGAPLGGVAGSAFAAAAAGRIGSVNLLLPSAVLLLFSAALTAWIIARERVDTGAAAASAAGQEKGVGFGEAFTLLQQSSHLKIIALVISFASVGAAIIEQQLNMAAEAAHGADATDAITAFLAQVGLWMSAIGFVIQVWLTSRIHQYLGIGFALMILPVSLGTSAVIMLLNAALWAPALARILDQSLRYTVDKTTREILFLPLPAEIKLKAKSFVDVTVDRAAKAVGALLLIVLVAPWGLNFDWQRISYASLTMVGLWVYMSLRARRGYLAAFRQSIERRDLTPADVRLTGADLSTVETLVRELSNPEPARVVYAIDVLESLGKRQLVTPLLLHHESSTVRERTLRALGAVRNSDASQWLPQIRRTLSDPDPGVRAAAIAAIGAISQEDAAALARPLLADPDPRIRATAAVVLAGSGAEADAAMAEAALLELSSDMTDAGASARRDVAVAIRRIADPRFQRLLISLLHDPSAAVADEAMESIRAAGTADVTFVPALISLLRHRRLKGRARSVLVSYGESVIEPLAHFMRDPDEDVWVRRHIPATLAQIPSQRTVDVLVAALDDSDGFLRFKAIEALDRLRRTEAPLTFPPETIERHAIREANHFFTYLSLHENVFGNGRANAESLLGRAVTQKMARTTNRVYKLLGLIYPWQDIAAAQWTLLHGEARTKASASEYLDNILTGQMRKRIMPMLEDLPRADKVRRGNVLLKTRPRDLEESLLQLINDDDQTIAAAAIDVVRQQQIWALADDVEHVLAHRDARDWFVFEAASWALAERRMPPERRRELWLEPLPAAELAGRLQALPLFGSVTVDELFRLAGAGRQARHESGTLLVQEGTPPDTVHLLLDGRVLLSVSQGEPGTIDPPAALGFTEALQGVPMRGAIRTSGIAVTLVLSVEELHTLLADNTDLVSGLFATLAGDPAAGSLVQSVGATTALGRLAIDGLQPVEKILALQRVPAFARVSADEARALADITRTVELKDGATVFAASAAPALWVVLSGEIVLEAEDGGTVAARAGDIIGSVSTLAGRPIGMTARATRSGIAMRIDCAELFELLGERPALLRQMFAGMFGAAATGQG